MNLKQELLTYCHQWVDERINTSKQAIDSVQASANEETKSSAGDKYETGRAMAQLEIEKNTSQLAEAQRMKQLLNQISANASKKKIVLGSTVKTSIGNFFLSISSGKVTTREGTEYICVSTASPLGAKLVGLQAGDKTIFNHQQIDILNAQ